jgi:hypothetical protein
MIKPVDIPLDVMIIDDTTPSMQAVQHLARQNAAELVPQIRTTFPNSRIGVMFNGDLSDVQLNKNCFFCPPKRVHLLYNRVYKYLKMGQLF